jgi:hypothetical protein
MSLINNLVTFSVVLVVLVFIYYLYHSHLINLLTKYNYDISSNPKLLDFLRTDGLLCPNNYNYVKSDYESDYCTRDNNADNCKDADYNNEKNNKCMKYKAFERNYGTIKYPKDTDDIIPPILNRCKNLFKSNKDIIAFNSTNENEDEYKEKIKWNALDPYYYSQKCQNIIKSEKLKLE